jgi:hypothetical protein
MDEETINAIKRWLELHHDIKELSKAIKERKEEKKKITEAIIVYMKNANIPEFNLTKSEIRLQLKETNVKIPLNQTFVLDCLRDHLKDEETVKEIQKLLYSERPRKIRYSLCCSKPSHG